MTLGQGVAGPLYSWLPRLGGAGVRLRLVPPDLEWGVGLAEGATALADITDVRLRFMPARFGTASFEMELFARSGARLKTGSVSRVSLTGVRDQKVEYAAFVRALHTARAVAGGGCLYRGGYAPWRFWLMALLGTFTFAGLAALLGAAMVQQQWSYALFLGAMSAFLMWPTAETVWRNRPVLYTPDAIPAHLLPV